MHFTDILALTYSQELKNAARRQPAREFWRDCPRGDWLLWIAASLDVDRRLVVLAACDCAETALKHVKPGETRPRVTIETARRWAAGNATVEEVHAAAVAAYSYAAFAAADAAYAYTAAAAYAAYAAADARTQSRKQCADLVRSRISWETVEAAALRYLILNN